MAKQSGLIAQDLSKELVRGKQAAFQYKPTVSQDLSWVARTENERNYLESERKRKEQEDLRNQLNTIQQLGLPKEMQGYLNNSVDELVAQVRAGEIDPQSYDFRSKIAGIGGEANQLSNINENLKTLAAEDKQVIDFDELGAIDRAPELKNTYFAGWNTDYEPGTDVIGKFAGILSALQRGTEAIKFDPTKLDTALKNFLDRNKELSIAAGKMPGVTGLALIKELTSVDPDAVDKWNTFVDESYGVDITSSYATDRRTAGDKAIGSQEDYARTRTNPWKIDGVERVTGYQVREDAETKANLQLGLEKAKKNLNKVKFTIVSDSFTIPEADPGRLGDDVQYQETYYQNLADSIPGEDLTIEDGREIYENFPAGASIKQSLITTTGEGKELSKITLGEQQGILDRVLSSDGTYLAVINVQETIEEVDDPTLPPTQQKVIKKIVTRKKYVPIEEVDVRKIEENYGVSILDGATEEGSTSTVPYIEGFTNAQVEEAASDSGMTIDEYIKMYNESKQ